MDIANNTINRMSQFIHHTLMMLEDAGMSVHYPVIHRITMAADGTSQRHVKYSSTQGRRVSVEQNQQMKFMMMFALLDAHVEGTNPAMEGRSYSQKYRRLTSADDASAILRELYRLAKLIRNALVHQPSAYRLESGQLQIKYEHKNTSFSLAMSHMALRHFYTALQMILRGDLGTGNYFVGTLRSLYAGVTHGIDVFSDEFGTALMVPPLGLLIQGRSRQLHLNPHYEHRDGRVFFADAAKPRSEYESMDFYLVYSDQPYLVPVEALDSVHSIAEEVLLRDWQYAARFPEVRPQRLA